RELRTQRRCRFSSVGRNGRGGNRSVSTGSGRGGRVTGKFPWPLAIVPCMRGGLRFFFFSSRRRHTRSLRDWSSDVCSSDLGGGKTLPKQLARLFIQATKLAVGPDTINTAILKQRGGHQDMQAVRFFGVVALALPKHRGRRLVFGQLQHHRAVIIRGKEEQVVVPSNRDNVDRGALRRAGCGIRQGPIEFPGGRIESVDG